MARLTICVVNSVIRSRDNGADYEEPEAALASGIQSGLDIITDEVRRGERTAAVEVSVLGEDQRAVLRAVVALSVSRLIPDHSPVDLSQFERDEI